VLQVLRVDEQAAAPPPEPANFVGRVRMQNLAAAAGTAEIEYLAVFFEPGARTRPHIHASDQVLFFLRGRGFVAFPGEHEQLVEEGGIVVIPAGRLHMHGATAETPVCHLAVRAPGPTDWQPPLPAEWQRYAR
jgi:quercetin dioxygenase-like cupin family protein